MDDPTKAVLVEEGTFRIDRDRALKKLRKFQLANPKDFHLDLARAGTLSGPDYIRVESKDNAFTIAFNGQPLSDATLKDPFSPLFTVKTEATERELCLAYGILAALRTNPQEISIESGHGNKRVRLQLNSLNSLQHLDPGADEGETLITVRWDGPLRAVRTIRGVPQDLGFVPARLIVGGRDYGIRPLAKRRGFQDLSQAPGSGVYAAVRRGGTPRCGLLHHYILGVRAGSPVPFGSKKFRGLSVYVEDKEFTLNLSRGNVRRSKRATGFARYLFNRGNRLFPFRSKIRWPMVALLLSPTLAALYLAISGTIADIPGKIWDLFLIAASNGALLLLATPLTIDKVRGKKVAGVRPHTT